MIAYGADTLIDDDSSEWMSEAIVDAVAAALSLVAPQAAEYIIPGSRFLKPIVKNRTDYGLSKIKEWADANRQDFKEESIRGFAPALITHGVKPIEEMANQSSRMASGYSDDEGE